MDSGSYAACAGLIARSQQLEFAAQNLANANTAGFRAQQSSFRSALADVSGTAANAWSSTLNHFGLLGSPRTSAAQGNLAHTGNPLDFAVEGPGYFQVQTSAGPRYTRNGEFHVSPSGYLVTRDGDPVLGMQGRVRIPPGTLAVSGDGTLSVDGALVGQLQIVEFPAGTPLRPEGKTYYSAPKDGGTAKASAIRQSMLENSNVDSVSGAVELIELQRSAQMLQRALNTFHSEFDRIAAVDLPRI